MKPILVIATFSSGSTYFQRAATFWIHQLINQSIVNPHEILNGLGYHNGHLVKEWMSVTAQSLPTIESMLANSTQPLLVRLSYDHLLLRNDSPQELSAFLQFLNTHFDVYVCCRDDLFDYGMCWAVRRCTDRPEDKQINNVHTAEDRAKLYSPDLKFTVDPSLVIEQAEKYLGYRKWAAENFPGAKEISYARISENMDAVLATHFPAAVTIKDKYGISISEYTNYLYEASKTSNREWPAPVTAMRDAIDNLCSEHIMLDSIPIKSTTMEDKMQLVSNFAETKAVFDEWASRHV